MSLLKLSSKSSFPLVLKPELFPSSLLLLLLLSNWSATRPSFSSSGLLATVASCEGCNTSRTLDTDTDGLSDTIVIVGASQRMSRRMLNKFARFFFAAAFFFVAASL